MKREILLFLLVVVTSCFAGVPLNRSSSLPEPTSAASSSPKRPNILLIIDDQHSRRALGVSGNSIVKTPRLDQLASEGVWFSQAYCNDPICGPSRYSMHTGRYPTEIGALVNGDSPHEGVRLLPEYLNELGYFTGSSGKNHFGDPRATHGFQEIHPHTFYNLQGPSPYCEWYERKFDEHECEGDPYFWEPKKGWLGSLDPTSGICTINPYPAELCQENWVTQRALDLVREAQYRDQPFFVQASYFAPHHPYGPLQEFYDLYEGVEMELPKSWYSVEGKRNGGFDEAQFKSIMRHYYAFVSQVDHYIGELLDGLDELGVADNTLVIMVSDHGDMMGEFGQLRKGNPAEGALAIPMFLRWPERLLAGREIDAPVSLIDVFPTIFDAIGAELPEVARGESLFPLVDGLQDPRERQVFAVDVRRQPFLMLVAREWRWKLSLNMRDRRYPAVELYDIRNDPWELRNLAEDPRVQGHRQRLMAKAVQFWRRESANLGGSPTAQE